MRYKTGLLFLLVAGSLCAMDEDKGIWDGNGNYLGPAYGCSLVYVPPGFRLVMEPIEPAIHDDVITGNSRVSEVAPVQPACDQVTNQYNKPIADVVPPALPVQERKKHWADDDSDDDAILSLPAGWVAHATSASSSSATYASVSSPAVAPKPHNETPPRFRNAQNARRAVASQASTPAHVAPAVLGSEYANWRQPVLFDDRLALAARNGRDNRQQFMELLRRKVGWLVNGCYERKVAQESEKLIYILDQNVRENVLNSHDAADLLRLTNACINKGIKRVTRSDSKQGFAHVAQRLLALALPSLDDTRRKNVQEIYNKIDSMKFEMEQIC